VRIATIALLVLSGCDATDGATDAASKDAASDFDRAVCKTSVDDYYALVDSAVRPADEDAALAQLCKQWGVVSICGDLIEGFSVDIGTGFVFGDGGVVTVFGFQNGTTWCFAGTPGTSVGDIARPFTTNACITDAGDASDQ
jgi:hypothetical protein